MAAELGLLSLNQLQKLAQSQQNQHQPTAASSWMWNPKAQNLEDDDSWEVRAFAEDTGNIMGTTWPPRSYTCTFCRREFRSAQALGGHMNVHRRDRARLHQTQPGGGAAAVAVNPTTSSSSSSTLLFPTQEFTANGGLCLLYQLPNPDGVFTASPPITACPIDSPSTFLSISSPYPSKNLMATQSINFPATHPPGTNNSPSFCYSTKAEPSTTMFTDNIGSNNNNNNSSSNNCKESSIEELDLELRLGHRPTTS